MSLFAAKKSMHRLYILHEGRSIGAVSYNGIRHYVFPLDTPDGVTVIAECPPDHLHHQGIMVGQDFVNGENFWAMLHPNYPQNRQARHGNESVDIDDQGVTVACDLTWITEGGRHILDERRTVRFEAWPECNFVDVTSTWTATYQDLTIAQTKEGGLGMRVHQQLETEWGGAIRSAGGGRGEAEIFDTVAEWIDVSGRVGPCDVGIMMMPHPAMQKIPWFTRDYGLHLYSPVRHRTIKIPHGESFSLRVGFAAYDGAWDPSRCERIWCEYARRQA